MRNKIIFPCTIDYKILLEELESKAKKGKVLKAIKKNKVILKDVEESRIKYHVTPFKEGSSTFSGEGISKEEFIRFNEKSGWKYIGEFNFIQVYSYEGDGEPKTYTIDSRSEYEIVEGAWKKEGPTIIVLIALVAFLLLLNRSESFDIDLIFNDAFLVMMGLIPLSLISYAIVYTKMPYILIKNKERVKRGEDIIYPKLWAQRIISRIKGIYIIFGFVVIGIQIGKIFLKTGVMGRALIICDLLLIIGTMYLVRKYGNKLRGIFAVIAAFVFGITFGMVTLFTVLQVGAGSVVGKYHRFNRPSQDMKYYLELGDFNIKEAKQYMYVDKVDSLLLKMGYEYEEGNDDGDRIRTLYIDTRLEFLSRVYLNGYLKKSENVEKHQGFYTFRNWHGDGVAVIRGSEVFIVEKDFEYNGDAMKVIKEMIGGVEDEKVEVSIGGRR